MQHKLIKTRQSVPEPEIGDLAQGSEKLVARSHTGLF